MVPSQAQAAPDDKRGVCLMRGAAHGCTLATFVLVRRLLAATRGRPANAARRECRWVGGLYVCVFVCVCARELVCACTRACTARGLPAVGLHACRVVDRPDAIKWPSSCQASVNLFMRMQLVKQRASVHSGTHTRAHTHTRTHTHTDPQASKLVAALCKRTQL